MSDVELPTGKASVEEGQGWQPMPESAPAPEENRSYDGDDGLRDAARDLGTARENAGYLEPDKFPIIERRYQFLSGEHAGEPIPDGHSLTAERAGRDLSQIHREESQALADLESQQVADAVDGVRTEINATPNGEEPQLQPESPNAPAAEGTDPEIQKALSNPKIRQAIEQEISLAQTERQLYGQAAQQAAELATLSVFSAPELSGLNANQIPGAIAIVAANQTRNGILKLSGRRSARLSSFKMRRTSRTPMRKTTNNNSQNTSRSSPIFLMPKLRKSRQKILSA